MNYEYIKKLKNKQKNAYNEAMDIRDQLESNETLENASELKEKFERCMAAYDEAEKEVEQHRKLEEIAAKRSENIEKAVKEHPKADPLAKRKIMVYQLRYGRDLNNYPKEAREYVDRHKAIWDDGMKRANQQYVGTDGKGGYLVADDWWDEVSIALKHVGPMMNRDVVKFIQTDTGGTLYVNKIDDTGVSGFLVDEKTDMNTSAEDADWTQAQLDAYKYQSGLLRVSNELINDANLDVLDHLRDLLIIRVFRGLNAAFTTGTGSSEPQGFCEVAAAAGFSTKGEDFAKRSVTKTDMLNLFHSVDPLYRQSPGAGWQFTDTTLATLRALDVSTDGGLIWQPSFATNEAPTLLGKPYFINPDMEEIGPINRPIFFGDWKQYWVREVAPITFRTDTSRYFEFDETAIVVLGRWDGEVCGTTAGVKFGRCATT